MNAVVSKIWRFQDRVMRLRAIMPTSHALRLSFPRAKQKELEIYLAPVKRNVIVRHGTSDVFCLQNIFLDQEYVTPFDVNPKLIIDGGANIGMSTLFFSQKYPRARIVAVEPEISNFEILKKNCEGTPNVTLINAALWPTDQALAIRDSGAEKWAFSVAQRNNSTATGSISAVTIPGLLRQLGLEYIDILKLDIEGAERELFAEGAESWLGSVGQIIIELHDRFVYGCSSAFYSKIVHYPFAQATKADNIFVNFRTSSRMENSL